MKPRNADVPNGANVDDLQRINDKLNDEVVLLINSLENQLKKTRESKRQDRENKKYTEGLYSKDQGKGIGDG
jgi:hypothetical protein